MTKQTYCQCSSSI